MSKKKSVVQSPNSAPEGRIYIGKAFGEKMKPEERQEVIEKIAKGELCLCGPNQIIKSF